MRASVKVISKPCFFATAYTHRPIISFEASCFLPISSLLPALHHFLGPRYPPCLRLQLKCDPCFCCPHALEAKRRCVHASWSLDKKCSS
eukprot:2425866-Rhodomonas_salina.2